MSYMSKPPTFNHEIFSKYVRKRHLMDATISKDCDHSTSSICCWRNGQRTPNPKAVSLLADMLDIKPSELITTDIKFSRIPATHSFNFLIMADKYRDSGVTIHEFADEIRCTAEHAHRLIKGRIPSPRLNIVLKLAVYFDCDVTEFYTHSEHIPPVMRKTGVANGSTKLR